MDNMMHGNGVYVWSDGSTYKGTFYKNRYGALSEGLSFSIENG